MDDGCFTVRSKGVQERTQGGSGRIEICVQAMSPGSRDRLTAYLRETTGSMSGSGSPALGPGCHAVHHAASEKFQKLVAPYIHPSMEYKLLERFRGQFDVQPEFAASELRLVPARILDIHVKPPTRSMNRSISKSKGHIITLSMALCDNSPETTTGGRALKFYASVRLDVRRIETLKDGTEPVGSRTRIKVVKNKCLAEGTRVFDPVLASPIASRRSLTAGFPVMRCLPIRMGCCRRARSAHGSTRRAGFIGVKLRDGAQLWSRLTTRCSRSMAGGSPGAHARDRLSQARAYSGFGTQEPIPPDHARLLGYLIGDGYVGGRHAGPVRRIFSAGDPLASGLHARIRAP